MQRAVFIAAAFLAVTAACGGSADQPIERPADPTERAATDEEAIGARLDEWGKAFSREDWSDIYNLLPPSVRAECPRGRYLVTVDAALMFQSAFISDEAWEALKDDASDGMEVRAIEITGDVAIADTLESGEVPVRYEDGRWWILEEEDPCNLLGDEDE